MKHLISTLKARFTRASLIAIAIATSLMLAAGSSAYAEEPVRHTVVKGDTLWDLASRYLDDPWMWKELWQQNPQIENPDLIFPGDVLLISSDGIRLVPNKQISTRKLSPQIRRSPAHAITTIDAAVIMPFLNQSIIVEPEVLENTAHVLQGSDNKIILGKNSRFFATGFGSSNAREYLLFSPGRLISDPVTETNYGVEGVHLGLARVLRREGDVWELEVTEANQDIRPGDRLMPIDKPAELPRYFPHRPDRPVDSRIISIPKGVHEAGRRDVVIVTGGSEQGLAPGNVLEVLAHPGKIKDPVTSELIELPESKTGTAMIFKTYRNVSYALLMETSAAVKIGDRLASP